MLKKICSLILFVTIMATVVCGFPPAAFAAGESTLQENLVENPGFEDEIPSRRVDAAVIERTDAQKRSGLYSAYISNRTNVYGSFRSPAKLEVGSSYSVSIWMKLEAGCKPQLFQLVTDPDFRSRFGEATIVNADGWTKLEGVFVCTDESLDSLGQAWLRVVQIDDKSPLVNYYVDDLIFRKIIPKTKQNLIKNPGFEEDISSENWLTAYCNVEQTTEQVHSGQRAARILYNGSDDTYIGVASLRTMVSVEVGVAYSVSLWLKLENGSEPQYFSLQTDPSFKAFGARTLVTDEWTKLEGIFVGTEEIVSNGKVGIRVRQEGAPYVSSYYTDDWCFEKSVMTTSEISGDGQAGIPKAGELTKKNYSVNCLDQNGIARSVDTSWAIIDKKTGVAPLGVTIDDTGTLTVTSEASPAELIISSYSVFGNESISAEKQIKVGNSVAEASAENLLFSSLTEESPNAITSNMKLSKIGPLGTCVEWLCDRSDVIAPDGSVQRREKDTSVTLTAKISDDFSSAQKSFEVVVPGNKTDSAEISFGRTYFCNAGENVESPADDTAERMYYSSVGNIVANTFVAAGVDNLEVYMVTAVYNNNSLVCVSVKTEIVPANTSKNLYSVIECTSADEKIKVFFLDGLSSMHPLRNCAELRNAYYVSEQGSDENSGSISEPFKTIQHAADIMKKGDTCVVREGTYRETVKPATSGATDEPIIFAAYPGEKVTISGADRLDLNWTVDEGNIYETNYEIPISQMFVNGEMMNVARWPNAEVNNVFENDAHAYVKEADRGYVTVDDLPSEDLNGAKMYIWSGQAWNGLKKEIIHTEGEDKLSFTIPFIERTNGRDSGDPWMPVAKNKFFIYGKRSLLDIPTEWVQEDGKLYLWADGGSTPAGENIEVKKRDWAFDLDGKSDIIVDGFQIFAASVRMRDTNESLLKNSQIFYPSDRDYPDGERQHPGSNMDYQGDNAKSVYIRGNDNSVRNCRISQTPEDGIVLKGERNIVYNCIIDNVNTHGDAHSAVQTEGDSNRIVHNSFYRAGRSLILHHRSKRLTISHNNLYEGGLLSKDLGATYTYGRDLAEGAQGSVISYNWVHDMGSETGIYLDSYSRNYYVHHNVVYNTYTGIVVNGFSLNNLVCNNTMVGVTKGFFSTTWPGYTLTQKGTHMINNIITGKCNYAQGENAPVLMNNWEGTVEERFLPYADSDAVDGGRSVDDIVLDAIEVDVIKNGTKIDSTTAGPMSAVGITDGYAGSAPDIGAYELGGVYWTAGAAWDVPIKAPRS